MAANVEHVSAWGSQRNLSIVAAFAQHVQQLAQQLGPLAGPEGEGDKVNKAGKPLNGPVPVVAAGPSHRCHSLCRDVGLI